MVEEVDQGGEEVLQCEHCSFQRGSQFFLRATARNLAIEQRGRVCPHLLQRNHWRGGISLDPRNRRNSAGGRYVIPYIVPPVRRLALRIDLCRRAEEYWPGWSDDRHRA